MQKRIEINSKIVCLLANMGAPTWVRPAMIWEERWLRSDYDIERAAAEAELKIKLFLPRKEGSA